MRIVHFQRKPVSSRYFSIENSFDAARKAMVAKGFLVDVKICRFISQGFFPRIYNTLEAACRQQDINHITGDVHYINLFFRTKKSILTIHDCVFLQHPSRIARSILKFFWLTLPSKKCSYITCISEATKKELLRHIKFPESRIKVIPTVVREDLFSFTTKEFNASCPSILHIGTTPNKNLERVAESLNGLSCTLHVVGPLSELQKAVLTLHGIHYVNETGISNERMAQKYSECDIVLFASTYEGFGMPVVEGNLSGRPVIASDIDPVNEVAGKAALLVNPLETKSIRQGIELLISDKNLRDRLVKDGKENAKRFSADKVAEMYLKIYDEVYSG